jgi:hypothetical protein
MATCYDDHTTPALAKIRAALQLAVERLDLNDCDGEEQEHIEAMQDALAACDEIDGGNHAET